MASISTTGLDETCNWIKTNGTRFDICHTEPTTYSQATTTGTYSRGNKTGVTLTGPTAGSPDGRKVTIPTITGGTVTENGTVDFWALTDNVSVFVCAGATASQATVSTVTGFQTDGTVDITIRDAA